MVKDSVYSFLLTNYTRIYLFLNSLGLVFLGTRLALALRIVVTTH